MGTLSLTYSDIKWDETQRKGISRDKVEFLKCLYSLCPCCANNFSDQICEQTKHMYPQLGIIVLSSSKWRIPVWVSFIGHFKMRTREGLAARWTKIWPDFHVKGICGRNRCTWIQEDIKIKPIYRELESSRLFKWFTCHNVALAKNIKHMLWLSLILFFLRDV